MKIIYLLVPAIGLVATTPAMAQKSAASDAVKSVKTAKPNSSPPTNYIPPPAPPPPPPAQRLENRDEPLPPPARPALRVAPRPPRLAFPRDPALLNYREALPTQADYPLESWRNDEEGQVQYRVYVDADGKPTSCSVTASSGYRALDETTCKKVMARARFRPAMKDAETSVAGNITRTYNWRKREPEFPPMSVTFQYLHNERGQPEDCKVIKMEGDLSNEIRRYMEKSMADSSACARGIVSHSGIPYRNENGVPVAKQVTVTLDVKVEDPD